MNLIRDAWREGPANSSSQRLPAVNTQVNTETDTFLCVDHWPHQSRCAGFTVKPAVEDGDGTPSVRCDTYGVDAGLIVHCRHG